MTSEPDEVREAVLRALAAIDRAAAERGDAGSDVVALGRRHERVLEIASTVHILYIS